MVETARRERWPLILFSTLVVVGLAAAGYLAFLHLKVHTDPAYQSFCSVNATVNCTSVAESRWAVFLGLPVATWGLVGYGLIGALALAGALRKKPHASFPAGLLYLLTGLALVGAVVLAVISKAVIHSWCLVCMVSWATTLGLFLIARRDLRRTGVPAVTAIRRELSYLAGSTSLAGAFVGAPIALVGALLILYPHYWEAPVRQGPGGLATGLTAEGSPWIGATDPKVTLEVFADYECPHCAKENFAIRDTLEQHPGVRLVFRNYPLDASCNPIISGPFHLQACRLALATTCAAEQGKFWELSDAIFQTTGKGDADLPSLVGQAGVDPERLRACMASDRAKQKLKADVMDGMRYDIRGTPAFIFDGRMYEGGIPPAVLARILAAAK
jgi:uncharacterized membrane protein/predicted DsbA family dithiol-disulfide isomerase